MTLAQLEKRTYNSWSTMRYRCSNTKSNSYYKYGAKGIKVCDRWLGKEGFKNFLTDMGSRPLYTSLDRLDSNGNYEPSNCRWATITQQNLNRRVRGSTELGYRGMSWNKKLNKWEARLMSKGIKYSLGHYEDPEQAALAFDAAAIQIHGSDAITNIL